MSTHILRSSSDLVRCSHVPEYKKTQRWEQDSVDTGVEPPGFQPYLCVPMAVQDEARGVLHLRVDPDRSIEDWEQLAQTMAERVILALANLELRQRLQIQAIHDPLTGLFNRRYMERSMDRELRRAARQQLPLGLVMVDIDHFKQFNDTFSYAAGDTLLQSLGSFFQAHLRPGDVVCRYGGEEFILILPDTSLDQACQYAEDLREDVKQLRVEHRGQSLGMITLSLGVAAFPEHGDKPDDILRAVDTAIHQAKSEGRDRVIEAGKG
jgi:diguanylate cyclase (GGDEF)-like protein